MKSSSEHFDIIIAGCGAAGLNLALALVKHKFSGSILLADKNLKAEHDKTWCFWSDKLELPEYLIKKSWDNLTVRKPGKSYNNTAAPYKYHCLQSIDFEEYAFSHLRKQPNITFLESEITSLQHSNGKCIIETEQGVFTSDVIYQSIFRHGDLYEQSRYKLKQHFKGWEIKTKDPFFDPEKLILMDFDVPQIDGVTFVYVLPFSTTEALVELTLFTPDILDEEEYDAEIASYIQNKLGIAESEYSKNRTEFGVIPMVENAIQTEYDEHIYSIGTMGGTTKASTGYTFERTMRQADDIARQITTSKTYPPPAPASDFRYRYFDLLILNLIATQPETSVKILYQLFEKNNFDQVFKFLSEDTSITDDLKIMYSCPWMPFFKSIWQTRRLIPQSNP